MKTLLEKMLRRAETERMLNGQPRHKAMLLPGGAVVKVSVYDGLTTIDFEQNGSVDKALIERILTSIPDEAAGVEIGVRWKVGELVAA